MAILSPETKLNNLMSQEGVIKENIKAANGELSVIVSEIEKNKKELQRLKDEKNAKNEFVLSLDANIYIKKQELDSLQKKINERNADIISRGDGLISEINNKIKKTQSVLDSIGDEIVSKSSRLESLNSSIVAAENILTNDLFSNKSILDEISLDISNLNKKRVGLIEEIDNLTKKNSEVIRLVSEAKFELSKIENDIIDRSQENERIIKSFEEREYILSIRERDLYNLIARFRKEFKKLHPNLSPQI